MGGRPPRQLCPPYLQATSCSGEELEELCPSLVSTRQRRYFLPLPSFFFPLSSSLSSCLLSELCRPLLHALAVVPSGCRSDTLDVTAGLFVAVIQDSVFFFLLLFQLQNGRGFIFDHYSYMSHHLYQKVKLKALCHFCSPPMMQSSLRFRSTSHTTQILTAVCVALVVCPNNHSTLITQTSLCTR